LPPPPIRVPAELVVAREAETELVLPRENPLPPMRASAADIEPIVSAATATAAMSFFIWIVKPFSLKASEVLVLERIAILSIAMPPICEPDFSYQFIRRQQNSENSANLIIFYTSGILISLPG
jgi:hypothetical protein